LEIFFSKKGLQPKGWSPKGWSPLGWNPDIGEQKKGDLKMVYVYKFRIDNILFLLAYNYSPENLKLIMFGPHENYFRDLKIYLKKS